MSRSYLQLKYSAPAALCFQTKEEAAAKIAGTAAPAAAAAAKDEEEADDMDALLSV